MIIVVMVMLVGDACVLHAQVVSVHETAAVFIARVMFDRRMFVHGRATRIHIRPVREIVACRLFTVLKAAPTDI